MKSQDCRHGAHGRCDFDIMVQTEDKDTGIVHCERERCECYCHVRPIPDPEPGEVTYDPQV